MTFSIFIISDFIRPKVKKKDRRAPQLDTFGMEIKGPNKKRVPFLRRKPTPRWQKIWNEIKPRWGWKPNDEKNKDRKPFDDAYGFMQRLNKKGWELLGTGAFSFVMAKKNSTKCLKIIKCAQAQDGWLDYVKWAAEKGYAGSFAPKVYSFKKIKGNKLDFYIASMEKLSYKFDTFEDMYKAGATLVPDLVHKAVKHNNEQAVKMVETMMPGVSMFINDLKSSFPQARWDLHEGNFLPRNDNFAVLTDPIAGLKSTAPNRWRAQERRAA